MLRLQIPIKCFDNDVVKKIYDGKTSSHSTIKALNARVEIHDHNMAYFEVFQGKELRICLTSPCAILWRKQVKDLNGKKKWTYVKVEDIPLFGDNDSPWVTISLNSKFKEDDLLKNHVTAVGCHKFHTLPDIYKVSSEDESLMNKTAWGSFSSETIVARRKELLSKNKIAEQRRKVALVDFTTPEGVANIKKAMNVVKVMNSLEARKDDREHVCFMRKCKDGTERPFYLLAADKNVKYNK